MCRPYREYSFFGRNQLGEPFNWKKCVSILKYCPKSKIPWARSNYIDYHDRSVIIVTLRNHQRRKDLYRHMLNILQSKDYRLLKGQVTLSQVCVNGRSFSADCFFCCCNTKRENRLMVAFPVSVQFPNSMYKPQFTLLFEYIEE